MKSFGLLEADQLICPSVPQEFAHNIRSLFRILRSILSLRISVDPSKDRSCSLGIHVREFGKRKD